MKIPRKRIYQEFETCALLLFRDLRIADLEIGEERFRSLLDCA
jgi:hypothetical protein